jgi:GT2 family glycosyltransferase
MARIFCVVVTYNGSMYIERCLDSILGCEIVLNTVVVDNGSVDSTVDIVRSYQEVKFVPLKENVGFARANNLGISYALNQGADFVLLLNQDAAIAVQMVQSLVDAANLDLSYGILSPIHLNEDGGRLDPIFEKLVQSVLSNGSLLFDLLVDNKPRTTIPIHFVNAAAWLVRRQVFLDVGGFDPSFFVYGEDNDYCNRVLLQGHRVGIVRGCFVYHSRSNGTLGVAESSGNRLFHKLRSKLILDIKRSNASALRKRASIAKKCVQVCCIRLRMGDIAGLRTTIKAHRSVWLDFPRILENTRLTDQRGPSFLDINRSDP